MAAASKAAPAPEPHRLDLGDRVLYQVSKDDADKINARRRLYANAPKSTWGFQGYHGNRVATGDKFPAVVVGVYGTSANLQVFLDGNDQYWATSVSEGTDPGTWS